MTQLPDQSTLLF